VGFSTRGMTPLSVSAVQSVRRGAASLMPPSRTFYACKPGPVSAAAKKES
jgi:hypothetical protein